jgi:hypothetical protein
VFYVGHVDRVVYTKPFFHCNILSKHHHHHHIGVHLVRGVGIIPASAKKFFDFQISREGFQSIDEYLVNHRNVDNFKWTTRPEFAGISMLLYMSLSIDIFIHTHEEEIYT